MGTYPLKWITASLAVGYAPRSEEDLHCIRGAGVRAIVNLCAECYDLHEVESRFDFEVYYLPIVDEAASSLEGLNALIDWMQKRIDAGDRILVHCRYGIGRTGTVVLAYLIHSGFDFEAARKMMKKTPAWPSSREQEKLIDEFMTAKNQAPFPENVQDGKPRTVSRFFERLKTLSKWR